MAAGAEGAAGGARAFAFVSWLVLLSGGHAQAQARFEVPAGCGSRAELRSELERLLEPDAVDAALPRSLHIARDDGGDYALRLELADDTREMRDPDCRVLFKTAVVVAAAAVDPRLQREPAVADAAREQPERESASWHAGVALGAGAALALLPKPALLLQLSGELADGDFGVMLGARYLASASQDADGGRSVSIAGLGGRLAGFHDPAPWLRLQLGVIADRLSGEGGGAAIREASDSGLALAVAADAVLTPLRLGALRLSLGIGGHFALIRPSFEVDGYGPLYRVPAFGGSAIAELGWAFR
jgi:hypothetical protein